MKVFSFKRATAHGLALMFFASMTLNIAACGSSGGGSGSNSAAGLTPPVSQINQDWSAVPTQYFMNGGPYDRQQVISISKANQTLTVSIPLPSNPWGISASSPIPELPGATVTLSQDPTSLLWSFNVTIPLSDLIKGVAYQNPTTLPDGKPLPEVPAGTLPQTAAKITLNGSQVTFYVYGSVKYFAIFFPTPWFNPFVSLTVPIQNSGNTETLGYFVMIPGGAADAGLYFAMIFPPELQRLLDDLFD